ncbi:MAG: hypothetical protein ABI628_06855 [Chloroflexota bacterium]
MLDHSNGAFALADDGPDLGVRELGKESEDDHVALLGGERTERHPDLVELSPSFEALAGLDRIGHLPDLIVQWCSDASSATEVDHGVAGDAKQPGPEGETSLLVPRKGLDHLEKDLLQEILAIGRLRDPDEDEAVDAIGVEVVQGPEGLGVTGLGTADQCVDVHVIDH